MALWINVFLLLVRMEAFVSRRRWRNTSANVLMAILGPIVILVSYSRERYEEDREEIWGKSGKEERVFPLSGDLPRSCEEWQYSKNIRGRITKGRNVTIDLDGGGPLPSFSVLCRTEKDDLGMDVVILSIIFLFIIFSR